MLDISKSRAMIILITLQQMLAPAITRDFVEITNAIWRRMDSSRLIGAQSMLAGLSAAKELLCGDLFASCTIGRDQFRKRGQFHTENPLPGDIVMFYNSKRTGLAHCGLVTSVENNSLHTAEGNTSSGKNVVIDNGGAVAEKVYRLDNPRIAGYCRMALDGLDPTLSAVKDKSVALFQSWLNDVGHFGLAVDGIYGKLTRKAAVKSLQMYLNERYKAHLNVDGEFGPLTKNCIPMFKIGSSGVLVSLLQGLLACRGYVPGEFNGLFGLKTEQTLFAFQKKLLHLSPTKSKICTADTWEKLFK